MALTPSRPISATHLTSSFRLSAGQADGSSPKSSKSTATIRTPIFSITVQFIKGRRPDHDRRDHPNITNRLDRVSSDHIRALGPARDPDQESPARGDSPAHLDRREN